MQKIPVDKAEKGMIGLLEHSLGCAIASRIISKKVKD